MIYPTIFNISSGEASLLCIFAELIKQADRISKNNKNVEGIVLIDEVDKHLHIKLQKEVLPVLINMFPKIQFILSTHSPFVNIGLTDELGNSCCIIDLDSGGRECDSSENEVFRQAYEVMVRENDRYANLCGELKKQFNDFAKPVVYLEGETDEKYFNKALEAFEYTDINIEFKWIGHISDNGKAEFTGKDSRNTAIRIYK
ncbi:MAG: AAA family ATPase, partial [Lachnospiraceae bacterium]|nr:AAA family ATPase [Lachnospiraceae bacterium]